MTYQKSYYLFNRACKYIPGGINTSLRQIQPPLVFEKAKGSKIWDADGNKYIDYHAAFGPAILGHNDPNVNKRVSEMMGQLDLVGAGTTELEAKVAEKIARYVPSVEKVLFCNAGSEATHHAIRLSRAATGRRKIIKFQGCYHGWHDFLLMNVISPPEKLGKRDVLSAGILPEIVENTIVVDFNSVEQVEQALKNNHSEIAAIILEPIPHNIGCVLPKTEFLKGLRELTDREGIVLIFDEVVTGFRHGLGGYQKIAGVTPDLTTMGKAMANGYPIAALGGRADLMDSFATAGGDVFFAGTFNAHPYSTAACLATIEELEDGRVYKHIFKLGDQMRKEMGAICEGLGIKAYSTGFGSIFVTYFMDGPVESYTDLLRNDSKTFVDFRRKMIEKCIFMLPTNLKRNHISAAHSENDIKLTLEMAREALTEIKNGRPVQPIKIPAQRRTKR